MNQLLKNCLLSNKRISLENFKKYLLLLLFLFLFISYDSQTINFISNGGFEEVVTNTSTPNFPAPKFWGAIDSSKFYGELLCKTTIPSKVPLSSYTYQWPHGGNNHLIGLQYCITCPSNKRGYPRNRLKQLLKPNVTYCFSMFVNLSNQSTHAIDALGVHFSDSSTDTILLCNKPITYLIPQVENTSHNIIIDTLNWVLIRGQFTATGNEKYCMIGNFRSDSATDTILVNPTNLPGIATSYLIDDVSLIESNLPAFAGRDTSIFAGDSVYLGRESDVGIDEACQWYKLPTVITSTTPAIDTIAGFWVKPTVTESYVVRQEICGLVKWDTVTIYMDAVGIEKLNILSKELKLYPIPAKDEMYLCVSNEEIIKEFHTLFIFNSLGLLIREEETKLENGSLKINTEDFSSGVYSLQLKSKNSETLTKKFMVTH